MRTREMPTEGNGSPHYPDMRTKVPPSEKARHPLTSQHADMHATARSALFARLACGTFCTAYVQQLSVPDHPERPVQYLFVVRAIALALYKV